MRVSQDGSIQAVAAATAPARPPQLDLASAVEVHADLRGFRLAVIGINYAPEVTGIAPYTTAMCEDLASRGAEVTVVTGVPHYPDWKVRLADDAGDGGYVNGVAVHRVAHYVPSSMSATTRARYEWTFLRGAERASRDLAAVDLVVGVVPALAGAWAAQTLAGRQRVPYAVIVQDLMGKAASQSGIRGGGPVSGLVSWAERRALRGVARVATVSQPMLKSLEAYGVSSDRTTCLPNYTHIEVPDVSRQEARRHLGWSVEPFIALHTGNMGYKQDLENVIEAARLGAGQEGLDFVLLGDGSQRSRLEELARDVPRVRIMDPLPEDLYALALRAADVLLVNERSSVADMCLPSKLTSYLASRRPVVAAVPANGGTASLVQESGGGVVVPAADPAALFQSVQRLKADPRLAKELGERGNVYAQTRLTRQRGLAATREFLVRAALGA